MRKVWYTENNKKLFTDSGVLNMESSGQVRTTGAIPNENAGSGSLLPPAPSVSVISETGATSVRPRADASIYTIQNLDRRDQNTTGNSIETSLTSQYNPLDVVASKGADDWSELFEGARFTHNGKYIAGHVESSSELQKVIESFRSLTNTNYLFKGSLPQSTIDEVALREKFMNTATRPRLLWQQHIGEPAVPYDGVPFISQGEYAEYSCVFMTKSSKNRGKNDNDSFVYMTAGGCSAKIFVRRILRFPSHRIADAASYHGIAAIRRARKQVLEDLVQQICNGVVHPVERYCVSFPTSLAHSGHIVSEFEEPTQGEMNSSLISQLIHLLNRRVVLLDEIQRNLQTFVQNNHTAELALNPSDPSLHPSRSSIFRHVYWLYKTSQVTKTVDTVKISKQTKSRQSDFPQSIEAVVRAPAPLDTSSTVPHSLYGIVMDTSTSSNTSGHELPDLSADSNTVEVQDVPNIQDTNDDLVGDQLVYSDITTPLRHFTPSGQDSSTVKRKERVTKPLESSPTTSKIAAALSPDCTTEEEADEVTLARQEVQGLLKIINNQLCACKDCGALHKLRRQLTTLCTQFSASLSGNEGRKHTVNDDSQPAAKFARL